MHKMPTFKETILCFKKKPFAAVPFEQLELEDKGSMIDEDLCHHLRLEIKDFQYRRFTIAPGLVSRVTGQVRFSCQKVQDGKLGETIPFNGYVVRNLTGMIGVDAVSGRLLSDRLADIPVKQTKPGKRVKDWVHQHWKSPIKTPSTTAKEGTTPPDTSSNPCRFSGCDWSNMAAQSRSATKCCIHQGLCHQCSDRLYDVKEELDEIENFDPLCDDINSLVSDTCDESLSTDSWKAMDPLLTDSSIISESSSLDLAHARKVNAHMAHVQRVRAQNRNWLQQFRPTKREIMDIPEKCQPLSDYDFLNSHFPGGASAARNIAEHLTRGLKNGESKDQEEHKIKSQQEENPKKKRKKTEEPENCSPDKCFCYTPKGRKLCRTRFRK